MSFVTWAALAIAVLVAAPVFAHLLRRRPPREHPFAATELVPPATAVAGRRSALQDRALLSIRALAVVALALLGASPLLRCSKLAIARPSGASIALAIVLDDSLSMRAPRAGEAVASEAGSATRFQAAREAAGELVSALRAGDTVALLLAGEPARVALAPTTNFAVAEKVLDEVRQSDRATDLVGALKLAEELLEPLTHVDKRVVLLSDLADGRRAKEPLQVSNSVRVWQPLPELSRPVDDCGLVWAERIANKVAVRVACSPLRPEAIDGGATSVGHAEKSVSGTKRKVELRVGAATIAKTTLNLRATDEGRRVADLVFTLPHDRAPPAAPSNPTASPEPKDTTDGSKAEAGAGQSTSNQVYGGATRIIAVLTGSDAIAADDQAPVAALAGQLRVGIVADSATSRVATGGPPPVEQALSSLQLGVQVQPLPAVPELASELDPLGVLIVDDAPGFIPVVRRRLAAWVKRGGVMLLTLGPRAAAAPLGAGFSPMLPALVRWQKLPRPALPAPGPRPASPAPGPRPASPAPGPRPALDSATPTGTRWGLDVSTDQLFGITAEGLVQIDPRGRAKLAIQNGSQHDAQQLRVLAAWHDGQPFILQRRIGRGVVFAITVPFSTELSDFALRPAFLVLLKRVVDTARSRGGVARSPVGSTWTFDGFRSVSVSRLLPDGGSEPVAVQGETERNRSVVDRLGLYALTLDGEKTHRVAAMAEREVDLRPRQVRTDPQQESLGGVGMTMDLSPYVALGLLVLLLAELLLRAHFQRRRKSTAVLQQDANCLAI